VAIAVFLFLFAVLGRPPVAWASSSLDAARFDQRIGTRLPLSLTFRDEGGRPIPLARCFDTRPVVLSLAYYDCPNLCTIVLDGQVRSFLSLPYLLGRDFSAVTVSIDPNEGPDLARTKKAAYLRRYGHPGSEGAWHFLTGRFTEIRRLADAIGFHYDYDPASHQYAHPSGLVILTPDGRVARYFFGVEYDPGQLKLALLEAAAGRLGSPIDQVVLRCYHYDPRTGKYALAVIGLIQGAGAITVLALSVLVGMLLRGERLARGSRPGPEGPE
jgi:protein SCO1/2